MILSFSNSNPSNIVNFVRFVHGATHATGASSFIGNITACAASVVLLTFLLSTKSKD